MSSHDGDDDYRVVARYKLNDGRFISLRRKGSPVVENGDSKSNVPKRENSATPSSSPAQPKRPSIAPRQSSVSTSRSHGAPSETSSTDPREKAPKLPPRPPEEELKKRRPSALSRTSSNASSITPRRPSAISRVSSGARSPAPKRPSTPSRTTSNASDAAASRRPSTLSRATSQAQEGGPKRPSIPSRTTSGSQASLSRRPSALSRSKTQEQDPAPKRPSLVSGKSSQAGSSRPPLSSTPSGRRVSFQDGGRRPSTVTNGASKLEDVPEDGAKRPGLNSRKASESTDAPSARETLDRKSSGVDKTHKLPSKVQTPAEAPEKPNSTRKPPKLPKKKPVSQKTGKPKKLDDGDQKKQNSSPAKKLASDDRDLKSILTEDECADLTLLIADITKRMREDIESHFNASEGLKLFNNTEGDSFENLDYDPGTVDVSAYDKERKIRDQQEKELTKPETKKLKEANLHWFDGWREVVILRVGEAVNSKTKASDQSVDAAPETTKPKSQQVQKINAGSTTNGNTGPKLEDLFPRVKTPLTKLPMGKRILVLHSIMLLLLSLEHYNAASRVLLLYLTTSLKIGLNSLREDEEKTAEGLLKAAKQMSADEEASKHLEESNNSSRKWKIRLASAAGAAVIGYTGGLAAPMIAAGVGSVMGELGLGATAAAGYLGTVAGSSAVVGSLFGAYGGRMTGQVMSNISAGVQDFAFLPIHGERKEHEESVDAATNTRRLRVVIAISGWLLEKEEVVTPWRVLKPSAEVFALRFELEALLNLGQSFDTMLQSAVYGYAQSAMVKRTVFSELMGGMMWPMALTKVARVVDNPFSVAQTRADKAGQVLADALINHVQGERPVTLVGYSLGARVIWSCLTSLAKQKAFGLVESAVLMGAPIPSDTSTWRSMRAAVSGRLVNVYSENDYLLAFLYRTSSLQYGVAGLVPITGLAGIENVDVTETVSGHLRYRYLVGSILQKIRFEDVDKDEVAKEAKAFEAIVEEEKKRTYIQQAGDLYENYKGKKPAPKKTSKKQMDISDADAEKQASAMEKSVDEKTQTGLMQWAAEQLYLSSPSTDKTPKDKSASTETKDAGKQTPSGQSYYDWAKAATYLSRSGGPEGAHTASQRQQHAQDTPPSASSQAGYLSSAAGYIPTGYVPSLRRSAKGKGKQAEETDTNMSKHLSDESAAEEASGYTSYLPSFGMGGASSSSAKEASSKQKGKSDAEGGDDAAKEAQEKAMSAHASHESNGEETAGDEKGSAHASHESDAEQEVEEKPQSPHAGHESTGEDTAHSIITSDTEGGGGGTGTDEDPFTTPPQKGPNKFADAAKAAESGERGEEGAEEDVGDGEETVEGEMEGEGKEDEEGKGGGKEGAEATEKEGEERA